MAWVTPKTIAIWESGEHVGANKPDGVVQVQRGYWQRAYRSWSGPLVDAQIWGEGGYPDISVNAGSNPGGGFWYPQWVPTTAWLDLPSLISIKKTKDLTGQNGATVAEIVIDAIDHIPNVGALGDPYHDTQPGYMVATRGDILPGRPAPPAGEAQWWTTTPWAGVITDSVKIRVWQGFGAPETSGGNTPPIDGGTNGAWTYAGQIDDVDADSDPNQITIIARNGKLITDQFCFGWAKSRRIPDPVTFYDTLAADTLTMVGYAASASGSQPTAPPSNVLDVPANVYNLAGDAAYQTKWESDDGAATDIKWVDIRLPQGRYDEFWLASVVGMFAYVGIFAHSIVHSSIDPVTGSPITNKYAPRMGPDGGGPDTMSDIPVGWVDLGLGTVPGPTGGWEYVRTFTTGSSPTPGLDRVHLPYQFDLGERSILRVGFTNLHSMGGGAYRAIVSDMHGLRRRLSDEIEDERFILVSDASEVVKVVLRWAGFTEWEVEESGVRLSGRLVFNRASYMMDIIKQVEAQLGFTFFIADPTDANSDGVPTFRRDSSLLDDLTYVAADLNDNTMLTALQRKNSDESRPFIIRVRGKTQAASQGGQTLGGDNVNRIMAVYTPPYAFGDRAGGIVRHIIYHDDQLISYAMCLFGCYLIAISAALVIHTATVEIPGHPLLELDDQVSVFDTPSGTDSRLWITHSEDTMTLGQNTSWVQTLQGALMDTLDLYEILHGATPSGHGHVPGVLEIDWSQVTDPVAGGTTGYMPPVVSTPVGRTVQRSR